MIKCTGSILSSFKPVFFALVLALSGQAHLAQAQSGELANGWDLQPGASNIRFQSVKNQVKVESSSFATFSGSIEPDGNAQLKILLDSVDTKIDLRNVRMRFLFFETFKFAEATISLKVTPDLIENLASLRRKSVILPFELNLHGITKTLQTEVALTLLTDDLVSVASATPLSISIADFGLSENIKKLEEAAGGINILPSATVTFDFIFARRSGDAAPAVVSTTPDPTENTVSAALETEGNFSLEACKGRFEILSRTGNIYFRTASAKLDKESVPLLTSIVDIVGRCPGLKLEVSGHTDSDGGNASNQKLSEARARSVAEFLIDAGISSDRIFPVGRGESQPVAPNDNSYNKSRNRRIEFTVLGGE